MKPLLPFEFNPRRLGFLKFKDMVELMNDSIKIELRHQNHPFAVLIDKPTLN